MGIYSRLQQHSVEAKISDLNHPALLHFCTKISPARCHEFDSPMFSPSMVIFPRKVLVFPARVSRREVLPAPLGPVIASSCPECACPDTPCRMARPRIFLGGKTCTLVDTVLLNDRAVATRLLGDLAAGRGTPASPEDDGLELPPGASRQRSENSSTWSTTIATGCREVNGWLGNAKPRQRTA